MAARVLPVIPTTRPVQHGKVFSGVGATTVVVDLRAFLVTRLGAARIETNAWPY